MYKQSYQEEAESRILILSSSFLIDSSGLISKAFSRSDLAL